MSNSKTTGSTSKTSDSQRNLKLILAILGGCFVLCIVTFVGGFFVLRSLGQEFVNEFNQEFEKYEGDLREYEDSFRELNDTEGRKLEIFGETWPSSVPVVVPEFNSGSITTVQGSTSTGSWSIVINDIDPEYVSTYRNELIQSGWDINTEIENQFIAAAHNDNNFMMQLIVSENTAVISINSDK